MSVDLLTLTESAKDFLQNAGHVFPRLESTAFDKSKKHWILVFDVGLGKSKVKKVTLDKSGRVISLE